MENLNPKETSASFNPDRNIKDCAQARELWVQLDEENEQRADIDTQVDNQLEGGRPYDQASLEANGDGWMDNTNYRDAESDFMRSYTPYWKLLHSAPHLISTRIREIGPDVMKWEVAFAEVFDWFIEDLGPEYYLNQQGIMRDYVKYGPGFGMFDDADCPMFKWIPKGDIRFPKRTKADPDTWELVAIKQEMTVDALWKYVDGENEENAEYKGWNAKNIKQAIKLAAPDDIASDPVKFQDAIVNNDLTTGGIWPPVKVVHLWAKNKKGKIWHYVFTEDGEVEGYLYEGEEDVKNFREIFPCIFYDIGRNGLIHSIKGFGVRNYQHATAINRLKCDLNNAVKLAIGINFVRSDDAPDEVPPVESHSIINVFPQGLEQLKIYPNLQAVGDIIGMMKSHKDENNYTYNDVSNSVKGTDTATQANIIASQGAEMSSAVSTVFLSQQGRNVFAEMFRRLRKKGNSNEHAKKFIKRCKELGIPDKVIYDSDIYVSTGATANMGSSYSRELTSRAIMTEFGNLPDANRRAISENRLAALAGSQGPRQFLLPAGSDSAPQSRTKARVENSTLGQGIELFADPSESHYEEADEHLLPLENIIQSAGQNAQLAPEHMVALQFGMAHTAQHVQFLSQDTIRRDQYKEINARFQNVNSAAMGIVQRLQALNDKQMTQSADISPEQVIAATQGPAR